MELSAPDYVILIVADLDRTLDFYTQVLGLRLGHRSGAYAQMDTGTTRLGFYTRTAMAQGYVRDSCICHAGHIHVALVGFQGRGVVEVVRPDFCHPLLIETLIFQRP